MKKFDLLLVHLVTLQALDHYPEIIDNYDERIHTTPCVEDCRNGLFAWLFPEFNTHTAYNRYSNTWLVYRTNSAGDNLTWDSNSFEWS